MGIRRKSVPMDWIDEPDEPVPQVPAPPPQVARVAAPTIEGAAVTLSAQAGDTTRDQIARLSRDYWRGRGQGQEPAPAPAPPAPHPGHKLDLDKYSVDFWKNREQKQKKK